MQMSGMYWGPASFGAARPFASAACKMGPNENQDQGEDERLWLREHAGMGQNLHIMAHALLNASHMQFLSWAEHRRAQLCQSHNRGTAMMQVAFSIRFLLNEVHLEMTAILQQRCL